VRYNARARFRLRKNPWSQPQVQFIQKIKRDNGSIMKIALEKIPLNKTNLIFHTGLFRVFSRLGDAFRVYVDTDPAGAVFLCRGNNQPSIARPQIVNDVVLPSLRHIEHDFHKLRRRWNVMNVGFLVRPARRRRFCRLRNG
jgi:hypothetical protein